ncbi:MAG: FAD-dependent oxidoreductase [Spirochaetia bacterium]|jgi:NADH dehydrogenase|nr:FAD-dependent oxidoreductase [Spirochaetia bacterium]
MDKKKIVILGGAYAGIAAAKRIYNKYKKGSEVELTIIDKNKYHTLMTELHEVAGSRVIPDAVMISFERIFSGKKIKVVNDFIKGVDFKNQVVESDRTKYPYDYLIIGTGGAPEFFDIPGVQENSFSLWSLEDALRIRKQFEERFRLAAKEADPEKRKRMLTFIIAGAGFTGVEIAGEFMERKNVLCGKYHIDKSDVKIMIIEALDYILPIIEEKLRKKAARYLEKKGIEVITGARITGATENKVIVSDGREFQTDTFIWTCGIHGSEFTSMIDLTKGHTSRGQGSIATAEGIHGMSDLRLEEDERYIVGIRGRILVNEYIQSVDHKNVYVVGDNMWFLENGKVLPQIVETALQTGETAAKNIIADIENTEKESFKSNYHGFMISIGGRYAVSNAGGLKVSGFLAAAMKHLVNLHYLFGLAGVNAVWGYMKHEFFDMKDGRTFLGDHFSWKVQGWWVFPLRAWRGIMWITEGLNKIGEGWLNFAAGSKSGWMFSKGVIQKGVESASALSAAGTGAGTGAGAADAVAAATDAGEYAAEAAVEAVVDTVAAASDAGEYAAEAAVEAVVDTVAAATDAAYAAAGSAADTAANAADSAVKAFGKLWDTGKSIIPYDSSFVTWFRETFMDSIMAHISYPVFQGMIVFVELAIGLALLGGLFTWLAAAASIVMCIVFTASGMFSWDQAWFVFAAFLMLGGAGRSLGLDHWVMPVIKKWWNGTSFAKKTYLYLNEPVIKK